MIRKLKTLILTLASSGLILVPLAPVTVLAAADIQSNVCQGAELQVLEDPGSCDTSTGEATERVNNIIETVINIFSLVVGVVAVIMIIVGGFRYITSGGDSNGVSAAKNTIVYAIIGLIIVAFAQIIVRFVLNRATSTT